MKVLNNLKLGLVVGSILGSAMSLTPSYAQGDKVGGGGNGVLCDQKLELLDLYEIKMRPGLKSGLTIVRNDEDVEVQVQKAFSRLAVLDSKLGDKIQEVYAQFNRDIISISDEYAWAVTNDTGVLPETKCKLVNIVNYLSDGVAEVNASLYDKLSNTDKAALRVHEVLYKIARDDANASSSLPVRRIVALLFSNSQDQYLLGSMIASYLYSAQKRGDLIEVPAEKFSNNAFIKIYWGTYQNTTIATKFQGIVANEMIKKGFLGLSRKTGVYQASINFDQMPEVSFHCYGASGSNSEVKTSVSVQVSENESEVDLNSISTKRVLHVPQGERVVYHVRFISPNAKKLITGSLK